MRMSAKLQGLGCVVLVVLFFFACFFGMPMFFGVFVEHTQAVPGDAAHFDPVATFKQVADYAGDGNEVRFIDLSAHYVRSDGTLDLNASYMPTVDYKFYRVVTPQKSDVPVGAPGYVSSDATYQKVEVRIWQPNQMRNVTRDGSSYQYIHLGMARDVSEDLDVSLPGTVVDAPACPFVDLWKQAIDKGAPDNGVAVIDYNASGYEFFVQDTNYRFEFDLKCNMKV